MLEVGQFVYDKITSSVGRVKALHAPGQYVSPLNQKVVEDAVLELVDGSSFVVEPERFVILAEDAAHEVEQLVEHFRSEIVQSLDIVLRTSYKGRANQRVVMLALAQVLRTSARDIGKIGPL